MTVAVCISEGGGMLFNKRRQSKDKNATEDMLKQAGEKKILISEFSLPVFSEHPSRVITVSDPIAEAEEDSFVFIENCKISELKSKIKQIYIYKWNRKYPFDFKLDFVPSEEGMHLAETVEFAGSSHEKITRELWKYQ